MTVIDARVGQRLGKSKYINLFADYEIMSILSNEIKLIVNMVPFAPEKTKILDLSFDIEDYDPFQPLEVLGRQCIADFFLHDPEQIRKFVKQADPESYRANNYQASILENFIMKRTDQRKYVTYFLETDLLREKHEIV